MKYLIKAKTLTKFSYLQDPNNRNVPCNVVAYEKTQTSNDKTFYIKDNWHKNLKLEYQILNPEEAYAEGGYRFWAVKVKLVYKMPVINETSLEFQESATAAYIGNCCIGIETNSFACAGARLTSENPRYKITDKSITEKIRHIVIPSTTRYDILPGNTRSFLGIHQIKDPLIGQEYILYISFPDRIRCYFLTTEREYGSFDFDYLNIRPVLIFNFKQMSKNSKNSSFDRIPAEYYTNLFEDKSNQTIQSYNDLSYFLSPTNLTTTTTLAPTKTTTTVAITTTTESPFTDFDPVITGTPKPLVSVTTTPEPEGAVYTYDYLIYYNGSRYTCEHYTVFSNSGGLRITELSELKNGNSGSITTQTDYTGYYLQVFSANNALTGKAYILNSVTNIFNVTIHLNANDGQIPYPTSTANEDGTNSIDGVLEDYETT